MGKFLLTDADDWTKRCKIAARRRQVAREGGGKLHLPHFPMHRISAIGSRSVAELSEKGSVAFGSNLNISAPLAKGSNLVLL